MRFLADECCPKPVVDALRAAGHDVSYVAEDRRGWPDAELLTLALEGERLIVTEDFDFGELAVRWGRSVPGIILVAMGLETVSARVEKVTALVTGHAGALRGHLTIVEAQRVRRRPLVPS